ncbi:SusC/RagA family TonB-linked outer membrane protein [Mucilaginibacter sp. UR6-1]|uniref:SusC/RagA family TonB-linked outer membrane protein n=1 Tax=Mucilaginibacter sp. UR6-1 TaxID=1435643 RepID=UPI001E530A89|nr:SusC/RagA family TonB-linked outer membrane protein [Mucilaginibacter sp. UR6-1]MCC8411263.1 SusC/RagA family TonB-linked outer membrane protein [Mucilaginibacter sp. UR6-1]
MKLTRLFQICFICLLLSQQAALGQTIPAKTITVSFNNIGLEEALKLVETRTGLRVVYNDNLINRKLIINQRYQDQSLQVVLNGLLAQAQLTYQLVDDQYIILRPSSIPPGNAQAAANNAAGANVAGFVQIGVVVDETGSPLPGVSIRLSNATNTAQSDAKGQFAIGIPGGSQTLIFTYIGYKKAELPALQNQDLKVAMEPDPGKLDEVTIIGYGTSTRRTSTGSQVEITSKELTNTPATNPAAALQGRVAGVYIEQANGLPGSPMTFTIRGTNSIAGRNNPLFIVDGVPYLADAINAQAGTPLDAANGATSPLNSINPADIETITVLKDADATAIYGSRGANGVVLITTKKGKAGRTQVDGLVKHGVSQVTHFVQTLSTPEYLAIRRRGYQNSGIDPADDQAFDLTQWDQNAYTDFQKLLIGNKAEMTDATLALSGGNASTNFRFSGTHHREGNVFIGDQGFVRSAANFNLGHKSDDNKFEFNLSTIYSTDRNNVSVLDQTNAAYNLPPNYPLYNPDGSLYWSGVSFGIPANPLGQLNELQDNKASNLISNMSLTYHFPKNITFKTSLGYSRSDMDQKRLTPMSSMDPGVPWNTSRSMFAYNLTNNYIIEPQLTYSTNISKGQLNALVGATWQFQNSKQPFYTLASDFASDAFLEDLSSAANVSTSSGSSQYKYASLFGRINYDWEKKYIINLNFRRDGSSRFGLNNRYGNFGSVGAAWIFSEENFTKGLSFLSFGKLRGSYGILGSDQIGDYQYLDSYASTSYNYNGVPGLVPTRIANNNYRWEQTRKLEAAIDLGFLKDRISVAAAFYRNVTGNQLVAFPLSIQAGFSSYQANMPARVENKGWEFTLSTQNFKTKAFQWTTGFNLSINRNKLLSFANIERTSYYSRYVVGRPLNSFYVFRYTGFNSQTGLPDFEDINGNGSINFGLAETGRGDRYFAGASRPQYYGGVSNTISYKGLTLDFLVQFVKQRGSSILSQSFYPPGFMYNSAAGPMLGYINAGQPSQPQVTSTFDDAYDAYSNYTASDAILQDASFIRFKNVSLSYDFKSDWVKRAKLQNLRLQVQAQNLFTITNYVGFDPESQGVSVPPLRTIVGVIQFTF